jgi:hypothetical protein
MVSNQVLGVRLTAAVLVLSGALAGCRTPPATCPPGTVAPTAAATAGESNAFASQEMTATEAGIAAAAQGGAAPAAAAPPPLSAEALNPNAPMHYTVKRGDTLWGIASMYLKDPWLWPELWVINPQIPNPHLIYPGDTLALAYGANGAPQVTVQQPGVVRLDPRLRSEPLANAIPTIPYAAIAAFLGRPTVATEEEIRHAPYVLAFRDMHQAGGSGNEVYLRNVSDATPNSRFAIVHIASPLVDPDDGKVVGYSGIYTATALVQRPGEPTKALLVQSARETLRGDRLISADTPVPMTFTPRPPSSQVCGTIINVVEGTGNTGLVGTWQVVVINRGKRQGLEPGNVLAIDHKGPTDRDLFRNGRTIGSGENVYLPGSDFAPKITLPTERTGTLLVFKVYDRVSYGLVVGADDIIYVGDLVSSP